jgi:hypothetical protein
MCVELLALDIFYRAADTGQPITIEFVEQRLGELAAHRPTCPVHVMCVAAWPASVSPGAGSHS